MIYLPQIMVNIILPPHSWPTYWALPFWFSYKQFPCHSFISHSCHMPCPSQVCETCLYPASHKDHVTHRYVVFSIRLSHHLSSVQKSYGGGGIAARRVTHAGQVKGDKPDEKVPWSKELRSFTVKIQPSGNMDIGYTGVKFSLGKIVPHSVLRAGTTSGNPWQRLKHRAKNLSNARS